MSNTKRRPELKDRFKDRMKLLLPDESDFASFEKIIHTEPRNFLRCNTIKMKPEKLMARLKEKGWDVEQPYPGYPEIILVKSDLGPGELGNAIEHVLGYYYIQEISSMLSVLALDPQPKEFILDLFAAPGSKTTQMAARMKNQGTILANDLTIDRLSILVSNLERCGVTNSIVSRRDAVQLCESIAKSEFRFDRMLLDAPCSGEGTLRSSAKTFLMWNHKLPDKFSRMQKKFVASALRCIKPGGIFVYSTCTHAPEENEAIVSFILENFPVEIQTVSLPLKPRQGLTSWKEEKFNPQVTKACRIYPQDNDSEGFFVSKFKLLKEVK